MWFIFQDQESTSLYVWPTEQLAITTCLDSRDPDWEMNIALELFATSPSSRGNTNIQTLLTKIARNTKCTTKHLVNRKYLLSKEHRAVSELMWKGVIDLIAARQ